MLSKTKSFLLLFFIMTLFAVPVAPASAQLKSIVPQCKGVPGTGKGIAADKAACESDCRVDCQVRLEGGSKNPNFVDCSEQCYKRTKCSLEACGLNDLIRLVANIFNFLIGLAGTVAMLVIVWSGIKFMLSSIAAFTPDETKANALESAKLSLYRGIVGLIIVVASYLIINTVVIMLGGGDIVELLTPFSS